ncbi:MAG: bifunctional precorrin-2 dehydrogenase/sirohydrochlorin ferrochelatase [Geobacteraceae bacterium]|nr:bifunctional precorrin-2 dehydrogenase/sirohydrochlorin ferrochelatase [Geobacteraceae bacterium]
MKYYPINIDIRGKVAIIVGGGAVAERKCRTLLDSGALVTVIAPQLSRGLRGLLDKGRITHLARDYRRGDLAGAFLVFAATGDRTISNAVAEEAAEWRIPANIADMPERSDFTTPASVARGDLLLTVSTGGKCPVLAREIREELEARFGEEYGEVLRILGAVREKLLSSKKGCHAVKEILHSLISHDLPGLLRGDSPDAVDRLLREIAGPGFSLCELGLEKGVAE